MIKIIILGGIFTVEARSFLQTNGGQLCGDGLIKATLVVQGVSGK